MIFKTELGYEPNSTLSRSLILITSRLSTPYFLSLSSYNILTLPASLAVVLIIEPLDEFCWKCVSLL